MNPIPMSVPAIARRIFQRLVFMGVRTRLGCSPDRDDWI
jgi:hypothetical protein